MKPTLPFPIPVTQEIDPTRVTGAATRHLDVPYASDAPEQVLDLYLPEVGKKPLPLVIYIHEGAFAFGSKRDTRIDVALPLLQKGFALASVDYRKSDAVTWPAQIYDVKAAVRFLRANARMYGVDPDRFAVWGVSAGGYLGSILGTTAQIAGFEDPAMGHGDVSSAVQAVVNWFGSCRFDRMDAQIAHNGIGRAVHNNENSPESIMMGNPLPEIRELCRMASPATYAHPDMPPFLIQHGQNDPVTPVQQSVEFAEAIRRAAGEDRVKLALYDAGHDTDAFYTGPDAREEAYRFLKEHLQGHLTPREKALEI